MDLKKLNESEYNLLNTPEGKAVVKELGQQLADFMDEDILTKHISELSIKELTDMILYLRDHIHTRSTKYDQNADQVRSYLVLASRALDTAAYYLKIIKEADHEM